MMKIGFDAKRLFNNFTGLGNYSRYVLDSLLESGQPHEYLLYTPKIKRRKETQRFLDDIRLQVFTPPALLKPAPLAALWRSTLPLHAEGFSTLDFFHGLSHELPVGLPSRIKSIVTIHDLIFLRYPQFYAKFDVMMHHQKVKHACRVADRIVAVSEQTARDVAEYLHADPSKISVVYQGSHRQFREKQAAEKIEEVRLKYGLPNRYILMLGSIEARKNAVTLVKAFALLPVQSRPKLVIAGKATAYLKQVKEIIRHLRLDNEVIFIHGAAFADLPALYQGAAVFAYPSLFEGFGIPIIEAIESGVPVVTSKGSCFAEAGGPHALYADPHQPGEWASALTEILENDQQERINHQLEHVVKFRSEENLKGLLNTYAF